MKSKLGTIALATIAASLIGCTDNGAKEKAGIHVKDVRTTDALLQQDNVYPLVFNKKHQLVPATRIDEETESFDPKAKVFVDELVSQFKIIINNNSKVISSTLDIPKVYETEKYTRRVFIERGTFDKSLVDEVDADTFEKHPIAHYINNLPISEWDLYAPAFKNKKELKEVLREQCRLYLGEPVLYINQALMQKNTLNVSLYEDELPTLKDKLFYEDRMKDVATLYKEFVGIDIHIVPNGQEDVGIYLLNGGIPTYKVKHDANGKVADIVGFYNNRLNVYSKEYHVVKGIRTKIFIDARVDMLEEYVREEKSEDVKVHTFAKLAHEIGHGLLNKHVTSPAEISYDLMLDDTDNFEGAVKGQHLIDPVIRKKYAHEADKSLAAMRLVANYFEYVRLKFRKNPGSNIK